MTNLGPFVLICVRFVQLILILLKNKTIRNGFTEQQQLKTVKIKRIKAPLHL